MTTHRKALLFTALLVVSVSVFLLIERGRNRIVLVGAPVEGLLFSVVDADHAELSGRSYGINNGMVDLGWGYSIKGGRVLYRISGEKGVLHKGDLVLHHSRETRLRLPMGGD